ncbi:SCO2525 family SAM-dependent methyltransferase [Streptomyces sp. NPDC008137]|uniref:SCO2525 family SAM-dependent methyltransferase n=1 Tax=Streptomyces sp. NPDC008137 TaxID=3364813 RepID=UPI0036EAA957
MTLRCQIAWESFDPCEYISSNYLVMHPIDASIIVRVRDFFSDLFGGPFPGPLEGIDVGAGPNLYPALSMLPWCDAVTLVDVAPANVRYLVHQLPSYDLNWDQFWDLLGAGHAYQFEDPRSRFRQVVTVQSGSLSDVSRSPARWSMGTMFFVAESITATPDGFRQSVACFMNALSPGSPFAAAFMEHSRGFRIGENHFPAHDVDEQEVRAAFADHVEDITIDRVEATEGLKGCTGVLLACGRRRCS